MNGADLQLEGDEATVIHRQANVWADEIDGLGPLVTCAVILELIGRQPVDVQKGLLKHASTLVLRREQRRPPSLSLDDA